MEAKDSRSLTIYDRSSQALDTPRIADCDPQMIRAQLKQMLIWSGVSTEGLPTREEMDGLVTYVKSNLHLYNVEELTVAYQYYMKGLLNHLPYDKFDRVCASFLERLMKAYHKDIRAEIIREKQKALPLPDKPISHDEYIAKAKPDPKVTEFLKKLI
jgi:hypothetical protein